MYLYDKGREWAARSALKHGTEIVGILEAFGLSVTVQKLVGLLGWNKLCLGVYKIGNG